MQRSTSARRLLGLAGIVALCVAALRCNSSSTGQQGPTGPTGPTVPSPTVPPPFVPGPQVFVGAGDIGLCGGRSEATARLLDVIGGTVFTLGDNAYPNGSRENYHDCYEPTWGRHRDRTRPSPGNHEYQSAGAAPYYDYFGDNAGPFGLGYYSYDVGAWHIISLNSNPADVGGAQEGWLRSDLAGARTRCTLAYWHHPLFSSGLNGDNPYMRGMYRVLYDAGADVVLNGHDHLYERFAPQDPDGRPDGARGIREFIVGTGGVTPLYHFMGVKPNSEARVNDAHGVLKMVLAAEAYEWEFVTPGGVRDAGRAVCH